MARFALSAIGRDRPGIVAGVSGALLKHGTNIEDSRMAILGGHFTMMLIVSTPADADVATLSRELDETRSRLGLAAITLEEVPDEHGLVRPEASHVVTVYGADHPGIVHSVAEALAEHSANITDMRTRLTGDPEDPVYVMFLELEIRGDADEVAAALKDVGRSAGVEVSLRELTREDL